MTDPTSLSGGFTGDPAAALTVAASGGCCGNPAVTVALASEPAPGAQSPCCGTSAEATAANSCSGSEARAEAVAAGQGC